MKRLVLPVLAVVFFSVTPLAAFGEQLAKKISTDPFGNSSALHKTEVEPDTFGFGNTIVSAFQVGRFKDGGATDIGWATTNDAGATWAYGFLPGITKFAKKGKYDRVSDASVAFDRAHGTWMISSLALKENHEAVDGAAVLVNLSTNGGINWSKPVTVSDASSRNGSYDKNWTACDNNPASKFFGHCYTEWDDNGAFNTILMSTSADGGKSWGAPKTTGNQAGGIGGQPVVQPSGRVIVPIGSEMMASLRSFWSDDGGETWSPTVDIVSVTDHPVAGNIRTEPLPSAEIDASGKVYLAWQDCRFEDGCKANDIVMSTSLDGEHWTVPARIPLDAVGSGVDHFIPGLAVDEGSGQGSEARLTLTYYFFEKSDCEGDGCRLFVATVSSPDGGQSWTKPVTIAGPISLSVLPVTTQGAMVGDYISTSYTLSSAFTVFGSADGSELAMHASPSLPVSSLELVPVVPEPVRFSALNRPPRHIKPITLR